MMSRYKPLGWRNDNYRHSLAARGYRTALRAYRGPRGQGQFIMSDINVTSYGDKPVNALSAAATAEIRAEAKGITLDEEEKELARNLYMKYGSTFTPEDVVEYLRQQRASSEKEKEKEKARRESIDAVNRIIYGESRRNEPI
jgi:hypothetical protein